MNCTAEKQLSHGVFESFEIRKDSFFTVPQCEDTAPIQIGEILDNTYLITRFIAQGGMGIVYEGIDLVLHRKVAIKVLVTDFDDEEYEKELKLFQTEINLCGNLRHPNVIQIYYSGIHHRLPYLVMEYIEGIPINEYVMKQRRFNWNQKVKLISQVASGLAYIHKNNILHRDIKPSNILVKADGTPVLIDFGISIKKNLATVATSEGELSGTIHYMSPEQVAGEYDKINERSDIYSLGLILYELLIKRPAYTGSPNEIIGQIFNSSLLPPSDVNINIPETLSNITMKAIAKEPEDRYSTATEFIEDLRLYLKNVNNKPIINKVPLWQKAFCYLKPNTAIAISLIWIAFFFIIVAISPKSVREYILNLPRYTIDSIPKLAESISYLFKKQDFGSGSPKDNEDINGEKPKKNNTNSPNGNNNGQNNYVTETTQETDIQKTQLENTTKKNQQSQIAQIESPNETTQQNSSDKEQPKKQPKSTGIFNPERKSNPEDTPEPTKPRKKQNQDAPGDIDIKASEDQFFLPGYTNWALANIKREYPECVTSGEGNFSQYIILNNMLYILTANGDNLTLTMVENFPPIDDYYYKKPCYQNESIIICPAYTTDSFDHFHHLAKIDLNNNNKIICYNFSNERFDNINFDNGQFFTIKDTIKDTIKYYFLFSDSDSARLYQLQLKEPKTESDTQNEPESNTQNGTIIVKSSQDLRCSLIENTSIVVLNDTLYYLGKYVDNNGLSHSGLCEVKVSSPQIGSQELKGYIIEDIKVTTQYNSLLVTDNINRIWIIDNENGVKEYNTEEKKSKKINSYPVLDSRSPAVSFYSNGYLYRIMGQQADILQAFILYVGVSPKENIVANEFTQKDSTSGKYPIFKFKDKYEFIWVNDSIQITLDNQNNYNHVFSFVTVGDKNTQKNWKKDVLNVKNDLNVIGIISKELFRTYYSKIENAPSYSVLISEKYYSLQDWLMCYINNNNNNSEFKISYKGETISVPCFTFWCIAKKGTNKDTEVQDVSKWYEDYKSSFTPREIEQFNYLDKEGCGITERCRLMYIIPNE